MSAECPSCGAQIEDFKAHAECLGRENSRAQAACRLPAAYRGARARFVPFELPDKPMSCVFAGANGRGKTYAACAYAVEMVAMRHVHPKEVAFVTVPELLVRIRGSFQKDAAESEQKIVAELSSVSLLVLDDLGAEKVTDFSLSTLYAIIAKRENDLLPTVITTNLRFHEISAMEPRIASRMQAFKLVRVAGEDRRATA